MFCRHVFGNISGGFRGISRVRDRAKYQKPCQTQTFRFEVKLPAPPTFLDKEIVWTLLDKLVGEILLCFDQVRLFF